MKRRKPAIPSAHIVGAAVLLALSACGSGGGSSNEPVADGGNTAPAPAPAPAPSPAPAPAPATTPVGVKVIDGPIRNATVCLDKNANGSCDAGEPSGKTDASGAATLTVPVDDAGKYPIVAVVGTDAVDADNGPVTVPFTLSAPADKPSVVSPLTTLVDVQARTSGQTSAEAEAYLRQNAGLSVSMFTDYSATATQDATAATVARLVVLATQKQAAALASVVGQNDATGQPITAADVSTQVALAVADALPAIKAAATDPTVTGATDRNAALDGAAQGIVANETALDPTGVKQSIAVDRQMQVQLAQANAAAPAPAPAPVASGNVRAFKFTDAATWYYRGFFATAADGTPDNDKVVRYYEQRGEAVSGATRFWGYGTAYGSRNDLHWTGTQWRDCPLGFRGTNKLLDNQGLSRQSNYCDNFALSNTLRSYEDVAGKTMTEVIGKIRQFPGSEAGIPYAEYGPVDMSLLGNTTMPPGSQLVTQTNTDTAPRAPAYNPTSVATWVALPVAAGGDARTGAPAPAPACAAITLSTPTNTYVFNATRLEDLTDSLKGTPCIFNPQTGAGDVPGTRNEWWGNSTLSIGSITGAATRPANTGNYYTTTANVRIGFTGPGQITWYNCLNRTAGGTGRNCDVIGTGTYAIQTLGDARVMSFTGTPALAAKLNQDRVFIERGGAVYSGYINRSGTTRYISLNLTGANALFTQLGMPIIVPQ